MRIFLILVFFISFGFSESPLSDRYHTYNEIQTQLSDWNDEFGSNLNPKYSNGGIMYKLIEVGFSHEDNLPIWGVKLTFNANAEQDKPKILILGQCHAEEILGVEISMALIDILLHPTPQPGTLNMSYPNGYRPSFSDLNSSNISSILENAEVWVIPTHNPEGLTVVHGWEENGTWMQDVTYRKNKHDLDGNNIFDFIVGQGNDSDGVDLNRNYDINWINGDGIYGPDNGGCNGSYYTDFDYYRGSEPFSEKEIQAIRDLALEQNFLISIAYHSSRSGCLSEKVKFSWVWEDTLFSPDAEVISRLGENIAGFIQTVDGTGAGHYEPSFSGSFKGVAHDWFYAKTGCFQYLIEVGEGGDGMQPSHESDINKIIYNNLKGAFYAINRTAGINTGTFGADKYMVTGIITNEETGLPVNNAEVTILEMDDVILSPRLTNEFGRYRRLLKEGTYTLQIMMDGYRTQEYILTSSPDNIIDSDFSIEPLELMNDNGNNSDSFSLLSNYPNPFNPVTNIIFELSRIGKISLNVHDINGCLVSIIIDNKIYNSGKHQMPYNGSHLQSGIYFYTLQSDGKKISRKFILIK